MGRSTEQSYRVIVDYLKQRGLPATVNDMIEANILSRATVYRSLRPENFATAALFGIKPLNNTKPYFFAYDPDVQLQMLTSVDSEAASLIKNHKDTVVGASKIVAANAVVLDDIERIVVESMRKHRAAEDMKEKDSVLRNNFKVLNTAETVMFQVDNEQVREILLSDINKFRTFLISAYVSSFNEE